MAINKVFCKNQKHHKRVMEISMVKICVMVMLMMMLVATQVECVTPECDLKCTVICSKQKILPFDQCMKACTNRCSVPVKTKTSEMVS